ncbi:MAG: lysophospholipid acyltransferase family protein [Polyangiales bacterium]
MRHALVTGETPIVPGRHRSVACMTTTVAAPGLLRRLARGPSAVRRVTRAGLFLVETFGRLATTAAQEIPADAPSRARRLAWVAEQMCALHGVDVIVRGRVPEGPAVYVANHLSYLDPLAIVTHAPSIAIAKREVADWPLLGDPMRRLGVLFVDRDSATSGARVLLQARRELLAGASVLAFPEGTTTRGDRVLPFRRGVFGVARQLRVPVVPVTLRYDTPEAAWVGDEAFLPHYVRTTTRTATRAYVRFDTPLDPMAFDSPEALAERSRRHVLAGLLD